jgi:hypothetical protein
MRRNFRDVLPTTFSPNCDHGLRGWSERARRISIDRARSFVAVESQTGPLQVAYGMDVRWQDIR